MKKILLSAMLTLLATSGFAQSDTLAIGYCNGKVASTTEHKQDGKAWNNAAIYLSKDALSAYKGNRIAGIRAGLVNVLNTDTLVVWVRKTKDGENLAEAKAIRKVGTKNVVKGWNKLVFDKPFTLDDIEDGLYVGYSFRQKATSEIISIVQPSRIGTSFIKQGTGNWKDVSDEGVLSIEALVTGDNLPEYDLGISSAKITPKPAMSATAMCLTLSVHNYGTKYVEGYTLTMKTGNGNTVSSHVDTELASLADTTISVTFDPNVYTDDKTSWTVELSGIDNATDCNAENNTTVPFYTYIKNVVLEEFTTEKCSNCPTAATNIHTLLQEEGYADNVFVVAHHVGYYTDDFTLGKKDSKGKYEEEKLLWFYNNSDNTYAPAAMVDRMPYFTTTANLPTPVFNPANYSILKAAVANERELSTNAIVNLTLDKDDASNRLGVNVSGVCNELYSAEHPYVMVYLIENDVEAISQAGVSGKYFQQHLTRAYNAIWGEQIEWTDKFFTYNCSFDIDPAWNKDNMEVVAFVYNYDADDIKNCKIENAARQLLNSTSGISTSTIQNTASTVVARYTLNGTKVNNDYHGITIEKYSNGKVVKVMR